MAWCLPYVPQRGGTTLSSAMEKIPTLREVREQHIRKVLKQTKGELAEASRILDIAPETLLRLLKQHGLSLQEFVKSPLRTHKEE